MELVNFRHISTSWRLTLDADNKVKKTELTLDDRIRGVNEGRNFEERWKGFCFGTAQHQQNNKAFKTTFFSALAKAEGQHFATQAATNAGLPSNWLTNRSALSSYQVKRVMNEAEQLRMKAISENHRAIRKFPIHRAVTLLVTKSKGAAAKDWLAAIDWRQLRTLFEREVTLDPNYARKTFTSQELQSFATKASDNFYQLQQAKFEEMHPGLAQYVKDVKANSKLDRPPNIQLAVATFKEESKHIIKNSSNEANDRKAIKNIGLILTRLEETTTPLLLQMNYKHKELVTYIDKLDQEILDLEGRIKICEEIKFTFLYYINSWKVWDFFINKIYIAMNFCVL